MVLRKGEVIRIQAEGVPLGLLPDRDYDEVVFEAQPGDVLVLFSDGVTDHLRGESDEYGRHRLAQKLKTCQGCSPKQLLPGSSRSGRIQYRSF